MSPHDLSIAALIIKAIIAYLVVGGLAVVGTAFVNSLLGGNWFSASRGTRRWDSGQEFPNAALVFFLWPIIGLCTLIYFIGRGFMRAVESAADKARELGEKKEKSLRGATK